MTRFPRPRVRLFALLVGAIFMTLMSVRKLSPFRDLLHLPATPFDRGDPAAAAAFLFLQTAERVIPPGETATVMTEPRDAARESSLFGLSIALIPGRRLLPSAQWSVFTPELSAEVRYVIVLGPRPATEPGSLVHADPLGTVWRRERR